MSTVTYYDNDGRLLESFSYTNEETKAINTSGRLFVEGQHNPQTHYIHNGQPTPRPASPITRSGLTLSNVPTGATLFIDGTAYPAQGTVDLSFPLPGTYALRVECFPYLDWTDEVTV